MTKDEFQRAYHAYGEPDRAVALAEAGRVNADATGYGVHVVHFREQGKHALMLDVAIEASLEMGIVQRRDVHLSLTAHFHPGLAAAMGLPPRKP